MPYHQKRFEAVLNLFNIKTIPSLLDLIIPPKEGLFRCRVVYEPEFLDKINIEYIPYIKRDINSFKIIKDEEIKYQHKYLDRTKIDVLFAQKGDCDEIIIVKNNLITDTSIANLAFLINNKWLTPKAPLLRGTTRERLLDSTIIEKANINIDDLSKVKKVALMNAMVEFDVIDNFYFHF